MCRYVPEQYGRHIGEANVFLPGQERSSPVAPSDFDRVIPGHRLTQTALRGEPLVVDFFPASTTLQNKQIRLYQVFMCG